MTESPRVPFTLVPREGAAVTLGPTYSTPRSRALWSSIGRWIGFVGCFGAFGLPVLIVIAVALRDVAHASTAFWRTGAWSLGGEHPVQLLPGVLLFSGFSALIFATLYLIVRPLVVRALVGRVRTRVVPSLVHPGEPLEVALDIAPRRTFELGRVEVVLVGHENVLRQGRKAATIVPEEVCRVVLPTDPPRELVAGRTVTIAARTTVPADAPWSFGLDGGEGVEWTVKVELEVLRGPDWVEEVPITVLPPGCRA